MAVLQDMTPSRFLLRLGQEIENLMAGMKCYWQDKRNSERILKPVRVFVQNMPIQDHENRLEDMYPSVTVKMIQGFKADSGNFKGRVMYNCLCVFGVKDFQNNDAWMALFAMYERIFKRFTENPMLDKYEETGDSAFELQADDTAPYYFMACTLQFAAPEVRRIDGEIENLV